MDQEQSHGGRAQVGVHRAQLGLALRRCQATQHHKAREGAEPLWPGQGRSAGWRGEQAACAGSCLPCTGGVRGGLPQRKAGLQAGRQGSSRAELRPALPRASARNPGLRELIPGPPGSSPHWCSSRMGQGRAGRQPAVGTHRGCSGSQFQSLPGHPCLGAAAEEGSETATGRHPQLQGGVRRQGVRAAARAYAHGLVLTSKLEERTVCAVRRASPARPVNAWGLHRRTRRDHRH